MATTTNLLSGRKWKLTDGGSDSLTLQYRCILDAQISAGDEGDDLGTVPKIGDAHPNRDDLLVTDVEYSESSDAGGERIIVATVTYGPAGATEGSGESLCHVDQWGWQSGTEERDLLREAYAASGSSKRAVTNSAGDPFDNAPKVSVFAPVFRKVMKFSSRRSGAMAFNCKVNDAALTIGGLSCPIGTLLCSVSEDRIFGDPNWKYQYAVELKYKSNLVKLAGDLTETECGWDAAVADVGMRQLDSGDSSTPKRRIPIRVRDPESGQLCTLTSPAALDGNGYVVSETDADREPRIIRFYAYDRGSFPSWFYSEPT